MGDEFKNTLAQGPYEPGYLKTFFLHNDVFSIELELTTGAVKPEGGKSNALYQNPASMHLKPFLDIYL